MPASSRRQPERLPPPLDFGASTLDAGIVLEERPDPLGMLLWKTVRSIRLWADLPEDQRSQAFLRSAAQSRALLIKDVVRERELRAALTEAAAVLHDPQIPPSTVAIVSANIARWCESEGALGTALEFVQAAHFCTPDNAEYARNAGRLSRQRAEYARAESWFRHAIAIARRTRDWSNFASSYIGLGMVYRQRGSQPLARKMFLRALRAAKRHSLHRMRAMAYHELTILAIWMEHFVTATRYARAALDAYPPGDVLLPALAHDMALLWMQTGYFREALRVFLSIPATYAGPAEQLARSSAIARSAGAIGDLSAYREAKTAADVLLEDSAAKQVQVTALLALARGAASVGDLDQAEVWARRAHGAATARGEAKWIFDAESLLEFISNRNQIGISRPDMPTAAPRNVSELADQFTAAIPAVFGV